MFAIIETGGKQYRVQVGKTLDIELLPQGDAIVFDKVLAYGDDLGQTKIGAPYLQGASVTASRVSDGRGDKIIVSTYKRRKKQRHRQGHRQSFTRVAIQSIAVA